MLRIAECSLASLEAAVNRQPNPNRLSPAPSAREKVAMRRGLARFAKAGDTASLVTGRPIAGNERNQIKNESPKANHQFRRAVRNRSSSATRGWQFSPSCYWSCGVARKRPHPRRVRRDSPLTHPQKHENGRRCRFHLPEKPTSFRKSVRSTW